MTAVLSSLVRARPDRRTAEWVVPTAMLVVLAVRLAQVNGGASPDEGGFLVVAGQWHSGGTSLYGNYWVDRPPLLISLFQFADLLGGLVGLRILGAVASVLTLGLLASTAGRVFGRGAAAWTGVIAAALLLTPLFGAVDVNGELLALPFLALGLRLAVEAVLAADSLIARAAAFGTGLAAGGALLVKQNMADVVIFAAVCWIVSWRTKRIRGRALIDLIAFAGLGVVIVYAVVMLWAMAHGTSPQGVYDATYPFRVKAAKVIAASTSDVAGVRLGRLGSAFAWSGVPLLLLAYVGLGLRKTGVPEVALALVAVLAWGTFSILAGGSYWLHYLIETVPALAVAAGAVARRSRRVIGLVAAVVVGSAAITAGGELIHPSVSPGETVGQAVAAAAQPGDTILSAFGDPDILRATGMSSPYPYLWSLPSRTLDPDMALLRNVLSGSAAPTWIVVRGAGTATRLGDHDVLSLIQTRYTQVGQVCGRTIYLLRPLNRPALDESGPC